MKKLSNEIFEKFQIKIPNQQYLFIFAPDLKLF